ncbi:hypothetical protein FB45DRAFT_1063825, partial [Roridomyces roridus]
MEAIKALARIAFIHPTKQNVDTRRGRGIHTGVGDAILGPFNQPLLHDNACPHDPCAAYIRYAPSPLPRSAHGIVDFLLGIHRGDLLWCGGGWDPGRRPCAGVGKSSDQGLGNSPTDPIPLSIALRCTSRVVKRTYVEHSPVSPGSGKLREKDRNYEGNPPTRPSIYLRNIRSIKLAASQAGALPGYFSIRVLTVSVSRVGCLL